MAVPLICGQERGDEGSNIAKRDHLLLPAPFADLLTLLRQLFEFVSWEPSTP